MNTEFLFFTASLDPFGSLRWIIALLWVKVRYQACSIGKMAAGEKGPLVKSKGKNVNSSTDID